MDLVGWGEEGEGGMYGESNMESYITECKIDSGNLLQVNLYYSIHYMLKKKISD